MEEPSAAGQDSVPVRAKGWYPDPLHPTTALRWWTGRGWSSHTRASKQSGWYPVDHGAYYAYWDGTRWTGDTNYRPSPVGATSQEKTFGAVFLAILAAAIVIGGIFFIGKGYMDEQARQQDNQRIRQEYACDLRNADC